MAVINPSAAGWIDKYFSTQTGLEAPESETAFYEAVRRSGFVYGYTIEPQDDQTLALTQDEKSKLALLDSLYRLYILETGDRRPEEAIAQLKAFYKAMNPGSLDFLKNVFPGKPSAALEQILDERVKTNHDAISKNFSHILTNALLFVDILAFHRYLKRLGTPRKFIRKIESSIVNLISITLKTKVSPSPHDALLLKLFEASVRYEKFDARDINAVEDLALHYYKFPLEKFYLIDIATMVLWRDGILENDEVYFLQKLAEIMDVDDTFVTTSVTESNTFLKTHYDNLPYFHYSNPVRHFYDNLSHSVMVLLTRNKKRLIKEISQSKELMILLAKSTQRDLSSEEKKVVKSQILEICKTIPSLTIFLLPGGSLLLPLLIKFVPQLLPSAFNENSEK